MIRALGMDKNFKPLHMSQNAGEAKRLSHCLGKALGIKILEREDARVAQWLPIST